MPYATPVTQRDGSVMTYDSGDYPECQRRALAAAGWTDFPPRREAARRDGTPDRDRACQLCRRHRPRAVRKRAIRIGAVRDRSSSPRARPRRARAPRPCWRSLRRACSASPPTAIRVIDGDTAASPLGLGAYASRQAVTAGNAVYLAAQSVAEKSKDRGRLMLEARAGGHGTDRRRRAREGRARLKKSLAEIAHALGGVPGFALPGGLPPGLVAAVDYQPPA